MIDNLSNNNNNNGNNSGRLCDDLYYVNNNTGTPTGDANDIILRITPSSNMSGRLDPSHFPPLPSQSLSSPPSPAHSVSSVGSASSSLYCFCPSISPISYKK